MQSTAEKVIYTIFYIFYIFLYLTFIIYVSNYFLFCRINNYLSFRGLNPVISQILIQINQQIAIFSPLLFTLPFSIISLLIRLFANLDRVKCCRVVIQIEVQGSQVPHQQEMNCCKDECEFESHLHSLNYKLQKQTNLPNFHQLNIGI